MHRLYLWACKRWAPGGLTLSTLAWLRYLEDRPFWCDRFDGLMLLLKGERDHCRKQYQRETRANPEQ